MVIEGNFYKNLYLIERNFTQISYPIREFFLEKTPKLGAHPHWRNNGSAPPSGIVATVYMLFVTVSEQKSKVRLISEISEFSYLALRQIRKLGKIFLSFRNDLNFICNCDLQWLQLLFTCFSWLFQSKRVKLGWFPRFASFRI